MPQPGCRALPSRGGTKILFIIFCRYFCARDGAFSNINVLCERPQSYLTRICSRHLRALREGSRGRSLFVSSASVTGPASHHRRRCARSRGSRGRCSGARVARPTAVRWSVVQAAHSAAQAGCLESLEARIWAARSSELGRGDHCSDGRRVQQRSLPWVHARATGHDAWRPSGSIAPPRRSPAVVAARPDAQSLPASVGPPRRCAA